ncbi:MAG: outer membrane lipoprotein carrier protein LolA [Sedimentisphaerales bacterium]|nr:outer membrane lipoprotein carrier protein LolA [Sedimentisphaerales bacterium]
MKRILIFGLCFLFVVEVYSAEPIVDVNKPAVDANDILMELEKSFSKIKTVQTDFVQTKKLKLFKHPVTIKGHILLQVPDSLLWRVYEPVQYALMLKGKKAVEWDQETGKTKDLLFANSQVFEQILVQIKSWFSGEFSELKKNYNLRILNQNPLTLSFAPKETNQIKHAIKELRVVIRTDRRYIESMTILEVNGDTTTTLFEKVLLNQDIPTIKWDVSPK